MILNRLLLGLRFYLGFAPAFSRIGYNRRGLAHRPVDRDCTGQTWLVTGASGGIGRAILVQAADLGASVIALARSQEKLDDLGEVVASPERVETLAADLSSMREIDESLDALARAGVTVDVVVNNVGVLLNRHSLTAEGFETSFATNLLGHYRLTEGLIERGLLAEGAAVVSMSSGGMYSTPLMPDRLDQRDPRGWDGVAAYARHKRAQVELTHHWNDSYGDRFDFHVMHPGWVDTEGVRTALPGFRRLFRAVLRNADQGADTAVWLGAERPAVAAEGIWLDRELRPEHVGAATRTAPGARKMLVAILEAC